MVFLVQSTQNRDNAALQAKLDELIRVGERRNRFIGIEKLKDTELEEILAECEQYIEDVREEVQARKKPKAPARA